MTVFVGAYRHATFAAGVIAVANALMTALATAVTPQVVSGAGLNGAQAANLKAGKGPARTLSITTGAGTAAYVVGSKVTITGRRANQTVQQVFTLANVNGSEVQTGTQLFDSVTSVAIDAQATTGGTIAIGVDAAGAPNGLTLRAIKALTAGNINVQFQDGYTDTITCGATVLEPSAAERVLSNTAIGCTIYWE